MGLSEKQGHIVNFLRGKEETKKSEITEAFSHWYYTNAAFHIGEVLHNMVRRGVLIRPKHGYYKIGNNSSNTDLSLNNPDQTKLF